MLSSVGYVVPFITLLWGIYVLWGAVSLQSFMVLDDADLW